VELVHLLAFQAHKFNTLAVVAVVLVVVHLLVDLVLLAVAMVAQQILFLGFLQ
jgi:hypothetical protein